jgi:hypothetical protein
MLHTDFDKCQFHCGGVSVMKKLLSALAFIALIGSVQAQNSGFSPSYVPSSTVITATGANTWVVPANVTIIYVDGVGAGGPGGGGQTTSGSGGGAGGGGQNNAGGAGGPAFVQIRY